MSRPSKTLAKTDFAVGKRSERIKIYVRLYVCMYVRMQVCIWLCLCSLVNAYICGYRCVCVCACVFMSPYMYMTFAHVYLCMYACMVHRSICSNHVYIRYVFSWTELRSQSKNLVCPWFSSRSLCASKALQAVEFVQSQ